MTVKRRRTSVFLTELDDENIALIRADLCSRNPTMSPAQVTATEAIRIALYEAAATIRARQAGQGTER